MERATELQGQRESWCSPGRGAALGAGLSRPPAASPDVTQPLGVRDWVSARDVIKKGHCPSPQLGDAGDAGAEGVCLVPGVAERWTGFSVPSMEIRVPMSSRVSSFWKVPP